MVRDESEVVLVDLRPTHIRLGWGGRPIPKNSVSFPRIWWEDESSALTALVARCDRFLLLGEEEEDELFALSKAREMICAKKPGAIVGFQLMNASWKGPLWSPLPKYQSLVYPEWIFQLISSGTAPELDSTLPWAVFHVDCNSSLDYSLQGHIPGATLLDVLDFESDVTENRRDAREIEMALCKYGITRDTVVILSGRDEESPRILGLMGCFRVAWILLYAGVEDVRVLDGGLNGWKRLGLPLEFGGMHGVSKSIISSGITHLPACAEIFIDLADAKLFAQRGQLLSVRSAAEFAGLKSGYLYIQQAGDIAGAICAVSGSDAYHMDEWRNPDNTMLQGGRILIQRFADMHLGSRMAYYCGTGWRASELAFHARACGFEHHCVYDGGWFEWVTDPTNPVSGAHPELLHLPLEVLRGKVAPSDTTVKSLSAAPNE